MGLKETVRLFTHTACAAPLRSCKRWMWFTGSCFVGLMAIVGFNIGVGAFDWVDMISLVMIAVHVMMFRHFAAGYARRKHEAAVEAQIESDLIQFRDMIKGL